MGCVPTHDTQQGRSKVSLLTGSIKPPRQRGGGGTTQGNAEMMDDRLEPRCAPGRSASHRVTERLGENVPPATGFSATKSANRDAHLNDATV